MPNHRFGVPFGAGVQLFFVLSGFLITGILLAARDRMERSEGSGPWQILRGFYARRFLRIFPLYYAALALGSLLGAMALGDSWLWHAAYLSNFYFFFHGWQPPVSHFWSLAVEEQFYLAWPFVVVFLPRRTLVPVFVAAIGTGVAFRWFGLQFRPDIELWSLATPGSFDTLGMGALLAFGHRYRSAWLEPFRRARVWLLPAVAALYALAKPSFGVPLAGALEIFLLGIGFAAAVSLAAEGVGGMAGRVLEWSPLLYLGRISYGIYIIHDLVTPAVTEFVRGLPAGVPHGPVRLVLLTAATVGLASLSWHLMEAPLNRLKGRFQYHREKAA
jgi:peptidoglycan/LPS O-acetylase OafA/YrhL